MANTTDFAVEKPTVGGYRNSWGGTINTGLDKLTELLALALPIGTIQMYTKADGTAPVATTNGGTWLVCNGGSLARVGSYAPLFDLIGTTYGIGSSSDSSTFSLPDLRARVPVGYNAAALNSGTVNVRSIRAIATTTGGTEGHILTEAQLAAHSHPIPATTHDHDIDPVTHSHVGLRTDGGAGTEDATLTITDPKHSHTYGPIGHDWENTGYYNIGIDANENASGTITTNTSSTNISIADHKHTFSTNAVGHGITTTETEVIGITSTAPDIGSNTSHNNMQPYVVVNYIILAKHPSF